MYLLYGSYFYVLSHSCAEVLKSTFDVFLFDEKKKIAQLTLKRDAGPVAVQVVCARPGGAAGAAVEGVARGLLLRAPAIGRGGDEAGVRGEIGRRSLAVRSGFLCV